MKRSNFLKSLLALPFVPKVLAEDQGAALPKGPYTPVEPPKCPVCLDRGVIPVDFGGTRGVVGYNNGDYLPDSGSEITEMACPRCAPTVDEIPQISRHYSVTTMKEIDRIWRDCRKKVFEGMETPWE